VADIQVRRHTQPPHHPHRSIVEGNLHDILPRPLGCVHQRRDEGGDDFVRVEVIHMLIVIIPSRGDEMGIRFSVAMLPS